MSNRKNIDACWNLYHKYKVCDSNVIDGKFVMISIGPNFSKLKTEVSCSKVAKFIINDIGSLRNIYGSVIDNIIEDNMKVITVLLAISEWKDFSLSRSDILSFLEQLCLNPVSPEWNRDFFENDITQIKNELIVKN